MIYAQRKLLTMKRSSRTSIQSTYMLMRRYVTAYREVDILMFEIRKIVGFEFGSRQVISLFCQQESTTVSLLTLVTTLR